MAKTAIEHMADEVARLKRQVKNLSSQPRLSNASIEDTSVPVRDRDGRTRATLGRQPDGSHGSRVVQSPPQPTPSAPSLNAGKAGVVSVRWDGQADGDVPLVHGHVEVVASGPSSAAEVVSTIRDRDGGGTSFVADEAGTWSVHLVMVGQDRRTRSEPSVASTIEVTLPVDGDAIQADIDQAKQDLADAEADWEQSKTDLQSGLDQINNTTIPQVRTDAQQWADDAEAAAVSQAAQDAQSEYDRLQEIAEQALAGAPNVVYDPSFETDWYAQAWSGGELSVTTGNVSVTDPPEGVQILRVSNDTGGQVGQDFNFTPVSRKGDVPSNAVIDLDMPVRPGQVWRFEVKVRALLGGFDGTFRLRCMEAGLLSRINQVSTGLTTSWQTVTLDTVIPDGIHRVYWRLHPTIQSGGFFADQVSVRNVTDFKAALDAAEAAEQAAQDAHAAAGDAWDHADTAMTRAGQVGSRMGGETTPTGTAPENSIWFQWSDMDDPNRTVLGVWQMIDGNWVEQDSSDPALIPTVDIGAATVGTLKAVRIDVASLFVDTQFVNNLHAEAVEAMRVTAETGFIGGVLLENGAITLDKMTVTSDMTAAIAEFLNVKAVHIDFNSMVGSSAFIAEMETSNVKLASEVTNRRFEISGEGWQLTDTTTGEVLASVGVDGTILMKNATVQGRFETSYSGGAGLSIDRGDFDYYSLRSGSYLTASNSPYIRLSDGSGSTAEQPIITADGTDLVIASGRDSSGASRPINLDGRVLMNSGVVSADLRAGTFSSRDYPLNMDASASQIRFTADDNSRVFGIGQSGYRLKIWGQLPAGQGQDDTIVSGGMTSNESLDSGTARWGTFIYGNAPRVGRRTPFATARLSTGSRDAFRTVIVDTAAAGTSGFNWVASAPTDNSGSASFQIDYVAFWNRD